jgi:hypothetical protein
MLNENLEVEDIESKNILADKEANLFCRIEGVVGRILFTNKSITFKPNVIN